MINIIYCLAAKNPKKSNATQNTKWIIKFLVTKQRWLIKNIAHYFQGNIHTKFMIFRERKKLLYMLIPILVSMNLLCSLKTDAVKLKDLLMSMKRNLE